MQTRIIIKKEVNSNNHEIMKFNKIYKLIITLFQTEKCCQKLEKSKSTDMIRELMCQHKTSLKTDLIIIHTISANSQIQLKTQLIFSFTHTFYSQQSSQVNYHSHELPACQHHVVVRRHVLCSNTTHKTASQVKHLITA